MKKFLMVLGVLFLVVIVGFVALLVWSQKSGGQKQEAFFKAALSGEPDQVLAMMHPALRAKVDAPVLAAWMDALRDRLGGFSGLSKTSFDTSVKYEDGVKKTTSKGEVIFEKGTADSELMFADDQLVSFGIQSKKLGGDWFKGPKGTDLYRQRGQEFLTWFLANQPDKAFAMMHPALQEQMPMDKLSPVTAKVAAKAGKVKSITCRSDKFQAKGDKQHLNVTYAVECENAKTLAVIDFQFVGLQGHIVAFDLDAGDAK